MNNEEQQAMRLLDRLFENSRAAEVPMHANNLSGSSNDLAGFDPINHLDDKKLSISTEAIAGVQVVLRNAGSQKLAVIKVIRNFDPSIELGQAKSFIDSVPTVIASDIPEEKARKLMQNLENVGAWAEIC